MEDISEDESFAAALELVEKRTAPRLDAPPVSSAARQQTVQQPTPQPLPARGSSSAILVSPRQNGNPILKCISAVPWEYSDSPADYVLGQTTCALFLSLKYHRLHPEYIYGRIRALAGKYQLRIILAMVDIDNHEEPLKELTKTSIINNVTVILCWSAQEAGRYLELYKSFENAAPTSIRAHQSTTYSDKLVDFITEPRGINKPDAISMVSVFGSLRRAMNAPPDEVGTVPGWGEKKVQRWCSTVREPFRVQRAAKRIVAPRQHEEAGEGDPKRSRDAARMGLALDVPQSVLAASDMIGAKSIALDGGPDEDEEAAMTEVVGTGPQPKSRSSARKADYQPSEGVQAALAKLRNS